MSQHDRGADTAAGGGAGGGGYPDDIIQSIPVPADKIGWVIGKEGSFIKQLEERSKAAIRVSDSACQEFGRQWKYVQVQGTPRAVDRAKKLLHIRLERLIQRLYAAGEGMGGPAGTAAAAGGAAGRMGAAAAAAVAADMAKLSVGDEEEQPVGAIEESSSSSTSGGAPGTVPAAAAAGAGGKQPSEQPQAEA